MRFMAVLQLAADIQGKPLEDNHPGAIIHKRPAALLGPFVKCPTAWDISKLE